MKYATRKKQAAPDFSQPQLKEKVLFGMLVDNDVIDHGKGYIFTYCFNINKYERTNRKLVVGGEFSLGATPDLKFKPVDFKKECDLMEQSIKKYEKLSKKQPEFVTTEGLTYKELENWYREMLSEMVAIKKPILDKVKEQIMSLFSVDEMSPKRVYLKDVQDVTFKKKRCSLYQ